MTIRMSGLTSGLDTESLVSALVSSYNLQKENLVKAQTKLYWKQSSWKTMNTSIYSFYSTSLANAQYSKTYNLKSSTVSDSTYASVTASSSAVTGTQTLEVTKLAASGYLTGGVVSSADSSTAISGTSTLSSIMGDDFSSSDTASLSLTVSGKTTSISVTGDTTINQLVSKLKSAGVNASYDTTYNRFFVSSTASGEDNDFTLTSSDDNGASVLSSLKLTTDSGASKVDGADSSIVLNGATFTNTTNSYSINGLTITANAVTQEDTPISITTSTDVDGIYDTIKSFFTNYNTLIKSMDTAYNADSSKGYEPLTSDEKEAMTDDEISEWETKIKDSLLRQDTILGTTINSLKSDMLSTYLIDGTTYSLSSFGIGTLSYFEAGDNEKGMIHIDGDSDDSSTSGEDDKLRAAIASDPDTVITFFSKLAQTMYSDLTKRMSTSSISSAMTIYNDKELATEYSEYTTKISDKEDEIATWEDYYYAKFTRMESALATLNAQSSSLSSYLS